MCGDERKLNYDVTVGKKKKLTQFMPKLIRQLYL